MQFNGAGYFARILFSGFEFLILACPWTAAAQ